MKMQKNKKSHFALWIIFHFVWMFLVYQGCIQLGVHLKNALPYKICTAVYAAAALILFLIYWIQTHPKTDAENVPPEKGKSLLVWIFPILIIFLLDFLDLFVLQYFRQLLSSLG